jgi:hypothetical protein
VVKSRREGVGEEVGERGHVLQIYLALVLFCILSLCFLSAIK